MDDIESIICVGCGEENAPSGTFCDNCRTPLDRGNKVSSEELLDVRKIRESTRRNARRRRFITWSLIPVVLVLFFGYKSYESYQNRPKFPVSDISASEDVGDWPMYKQNASHNGFYGRDDFELEGRIIWTFKTDGPIVSEPAVVASTVYLTTGHQSDRRIVALRRSDGSVLWEYDVEYPIESTPAVAEGYVYVSTRDGRVISLDRHDGSVRWIYNHSSPLFSSPSIYKGTLYVGTYDKQLLAIDAVNGEILWIYDVGSRVSSAPAVNGQIVAFNTDSAYVHIIDSKTGEFRLDFPTAQTYSSVVISGERILTADWKGRLRAIDWTKKERLFEKRLRTVRLYLYMWGLTDYLPVWTGSLWTFAPERCKKMECFKQGFLGTPVAYGGVAYIASASGKIYKVDEFSGEEIWGSNVEAEVTESLVATNNNVLVADSDGMIHVLNSETGGSSARFQVEGSASTSPIVARGTLYIGTSDGVLYAIE